MIKSFYFSSSRQRIQAKMSDNVVKFAKLQSHPEENFWAKFAELKIDKFKLEDKTKIPLWASYSLRSAELGPRRLCLDYTSFNE